MSKETEADTRANRIDPVLNEAGWGFGATAGANVKREVDVKITNGPIVPGGGHDETKKFFADYVLLHHDRPLAVIEAKAHGLGAQAGVGQAVNYADRLGARFAYATDGGQWYGIDMKTNDRGDVSLPFPSPDQLWERTFGVPPQRGASALGTGSSEPTANDWRLRFGEVSHNGADGKWEPRYYQRRAINAALDAISEGRKRVLLTLATGTGKTAIAFQIAWKLYQARWNLSGANRRPRILFLADRNILADQAVNAFDAFRADEVIRIDPERIAKDGRVPTNGSVFFSIFQTLMTDKKGAGALAAREIEADAPTEKAKRPNYLDYEPDFFDLIVIDECHRGGANDESAWRGILEHFEPAVQLGLTATPKRDANADTYDWFGAPVYEYSLKAGIEDGFLTPFKVRQIVSSMDEYRPKPGDVTDGELEDRVYTEGEFNTKIVVPKRERSRVEKFMSEIDQRQKTLVFCATQEHAAMVREMISEVAGKGPLYCQRVTADDGKTGEQYLRVFQDNEKIVPTVLTTSRKLSTGVDARNVRNIVLMRPINSMVEFKQIIGRGTRTFEGKDHFTIYDFVKAYEHFEDPEWDGPPAEPPTGPGSRPTSTDPADPDPSPSPSNGEDDPTPSKPVTVTLGPGHKPITYVAATIYMLDGKPVSAKAFLERLYGDLGTMVADEDDLRDRWSQPDTRAQFLVELKDRGYDQDKLEEMRHLIDASNSDIFDVLARIRFDLDPRTREERAADAERNALATYDNAMREFLQSVLSGYKRNGISELEVDQLSNVLSARYGSMGDAKRQLGKVAAIKSAFVNMQRDIYRL